MNTCRTLVSFPSSLWANKTKCTVTRRWGGFGNEMALFWTSAIYKSCTSVSFSPWTPTQRVVGTRISRTMIFCYRLTTTQGQSAIFHTRHTPQLQSSMASYSPSFILLVSFAGLPRFWEWGYHFHLQFLDWDTFVLSLQICLAPSLKFYKAHSNGLVPFRLLP